ncbi:MAG: monooxygenase [Pirellula sp.]|nr:monooxygenase [Pirellula sp.]
MDESAPSEVVVSVVETGCIVVGAGPAGAVLALLLARAGVKVTLLESHADFNRDFRGDTIHPSTLELLDQLGLAERVLEMPHGKLTSMRVITPDGAVTMADLSRLPTKFPYVATLPQEKLLEVLVDAARAYDTFELVMQANVQRLVEEQGVVRGVRYRDSRNEWHELRAGLTVAADGRFSKLRHLAGIEPVSSAPPMDVVWFRLPKQASDGRHDAEIHIGGGRFAVLLDRAEEWQIGYVILKGSFAALREAGIEALHDGLRTVVPWLADRVELLQDWKQCAVLNVESSRVPSWHKPGLLLIGDAAHVMSPVGGVGINVAVQDAIAAANLLTGPLLRGIPTEPELAAVQKLREPAVKLVQRMQRVIQENIAKPGLTGKKFQMPWWARLASHVPIVRDIPGKMMAFGPHRVRYQDFSR